MEITRERERRRRREREMEGRNKREIKKKRWSTRSQINKYQVSDQFRLDEK